jgi:DNA-binding IclR family transcriptional regulator
MHGLVKQAAAEASTPRSTRQVLARRPIVPIGYAREQRVHIVYLWGGVVLPVPESGGPRAEIQAVDRVAQILSLFTADRTHLTTSGVAAALRLNRTTAHRYLTSMAAEDLITPTTDPPGYRLGGLVVRLAGLTIGERHVVALAADAMQRLAKEVGGNISLSLWSEAGPVVAAVREPPGGRIVLTFQVGAVMPFDTAQGAVFLAFARNRADAESTIMSMPEPARSITRAKVAEARRTGLATAVTEANGTCGLAAPIFDGGGICAALAIVDPISSSAATTFPYRLARLQQTAQELTVRLGGTAPTSVA